MKGEILKTNAQLKIVTLGDVVEETQYGTSLKANDQGYGVPVLRMGNITYSGSLDLTDLKHVDLPTKDLAQYSVCRGDLLFNRTNSQELVGKMSVWNRDEQFAFAGYLVRLRLKTERAEPAFVSAWFNTPEMKTLLRTRAKPSINMSNINATEVLKFPVPLPPLKEQRRIAEVLDRAEALRAKRRAALSELGSLTKSLFLDLFGDSRANPKKWPKLKLGDLLEIEWGNTSITKASYVPTGVPAYSATGCDGFLPQGEHEGEGIVLSAIGARCGKCFYIEGGLWTAIKNTITIRPKQKPRVDLKYFFPMANDEGFWPNRGAGQPFITLAIARMQEIPVPPLALQQEFARQVAAVEKLKQAQRTSLAELDALFATLQHRAFRGEL